MQVVATQQPLGEYEIYLTVEGHKVQVMNVELVDKLDFINFAPQLSEEIKQHPILVRGGQFAPVFFPAFIDLEEDDFTIEIIAPDSIPDFLNLQIDDEQKVVYLDSGRVPAEADVGTYEVEIELKDSSGQKKTEQIIIEIIDNVYLNFEFENQETEIKVQVEEPQDENGENDSEVRAYISETNDQGGIIVKFNQDVKITQQRRLSEEVSLNRSMFNVYIQPSQKSKDYLIENKLLDQINIS